MDNKILFWDLRNMVPGALHVSQLKAVLNDHYQKRNTSRHIKIAGLLRGYIIAWIRSFCSIVTTDIIKLVYKVPRNYWDKEII